MILAASTSPHRTRSSMQNFQASFISCDHIIGSIAVVWRSGKLESMNQSVAVKFPANILKSQNYLLQISGIAGKGEAEIISGYPFNVVID